MTRAEAITEIETILKNNISCPYDHAAPFARVAEKIVDQLMCTNSKECEMRGWFGG